MINKFKRTITSIIPVEKGRSGSCNGCGDCCSLPKRCTFLTTDNTGNNRCSIYKIRPPNCRKFPRDKSQLSLVEENCGFTFNVINHHK